MSVFSVDTPAMDVEETMHAVNDRLRRWEEGEASYLDGTSTSDEDDRLVRQARQLRLQWNIDGNAIIHSSRPGVGPWIVRFQTIVRRLTWWFLDPILQQIRLFQLNTARVVDRSTQNQESLTQRVEELEAQIQALRDRLDASERLGDDGT